jgi:hypothetical protein
MVRMEQDDQPLVHVVFPLEVDDGWPPVSAERVWAARVRNDTYRVENAPWFALGVAAGDIVYAVAPDDDSWPVFVEKREWSGNCTIRLILAQDGELEGDPQAVLDRFTPFGIDGEVAAKYRLVALTVPPSAPVRQVKDVLRRGEAEGWWAYEEGCVGDNWRAL